MSIVYRMVCSVFMSLSLVMLGAGNAVARMNVNFNDGECVFQDQKGTLKKIDKHGNVTNVFDTDVKINNVYVHANNTCYIHFESPQTLLTNGAAYILARADVANNKITGIDSNLTDLIWDNSSDTTPNVQFDDVGNIYYLAHETEKTVLKKYQDERHIFNLINDNIYLDNWLVTTNGTVLMGGTTQSTGAEWLRKLTPDNNLTTLAPSNPKWLQCFPDKRVYCGLWGGSYNGVYRLPIDLTVFHYSTNYIGSYDCAETSFSEYPIFTGEGGLGSNNGAYIDAYQQTPSKHVFVITRWNNAQAVLSYYPIPHKLSLKLIDTPTLLGQISDFLLIAGTKDGANKLVSYDPVTSNETSILNENIEIYHLTTTGDGAVWFDGLNFTGNKYVVGKVEILGHINSSKMNRTASYTEMARLDGKLTSLAGLPGTRLPAPGNLTATAGTYSDKVLLSWAAVEEATYYKIYRDATDDNDGSMVLGETATTNYVDSAAIPGTRYRYWIQAYNSTNYSDFSDAVIGYCASLTPSVPTNLPIVNDYDGDGSSELVVYDNNVGNWYAYSLQTGQATVWAHSWGWPGAKTVPGDYDGDARSDLAVYDQNTGCWYIWSEARQQALLWQHAWGWAGAETVPGDYDGDGCSDLAVYDQNTGNWYVWSDARQQALIWAHEWGWPGATTVPGDYDGDACSDLAVYDQNTGHWYIWSDAKQQVLAWQHEWGWPGATTVPGDYDGDGKSDLCVYDQATGAWFVWSLADEKTLIWAKDWGWTGAVPVPGDYDGDGCADLAVFDTISGLWYVWSEAKQELLAWQHEWGWAGAYPPGGRY